MEAGTVKLRHFLLLFLLGSANGSALFTTGIIGSRVGTGADLTPFRYFSPFGESQSSGVQTVFTFTAATDKQGDPSGGDITIFTVVDSKTLPAGTYSVNYHVTVFNDSGTAGSGSQQAMLGASDVLLNMGDDSLTCDRLPSSGTSLSDMIQANETDFAADPAALSMSDDSTPAHTTSTCTSTAAVWQNPTTQTVKWEISTNLNCFVKAGSTITLTKQ